MRNQLFPALSTFVLFLTVILICLSWMRYIHPKAIIHQSNPIMRLALGITFWLLLLAGQISAQSTMLDGQTPPGVAPGAPAGSYTLSGFENVNLYNGKLNFSLPLATASGRGGASYTIPLNLEQNWYFERSCIGCINGPDDRVSTVGPIPQPGFSPGVMFGRRVMDPLPSCSSGGGIRIIRTLTRLTFITSNGTQYELIDQLSGGEDKTVTFECGGAPPRQGALRGTVFITHDGSGASFISDSPIYDENYHVIFPIPLFYPTGDLVLRDGTRYRIVEGRVQWIRDRNGNKVTFEYDQAGIRLRKVTDSLNREIMITYGNPDVITYKGFGGTPRTIKIWRASLNSAFNGTPLLRADFPLPTLTPPQLFPQAYWLLPETYGPYNPFIVAAVELPDGRQYKFRYNYYGELARVELPTGGTYEYDYVGAAGGGSSLYNVNFENTPMVYRRLVERRVYREGGLMEGKTTYTFSELDNLQSIRVIADHKTPSGEILSREEHYFSGHPINSYNLLAFDRPAWFEGLETQIDLFAADTRTLLRRTVHTWQQRAPVSWWQPHRGPEPTNDPRLVETVTRLTDANLVSKQTFNYDQYNNVTEIREYGFGNGTPGPLLRRTHTDYLTNNLYQGNINYATDFNIHIRNLPTMVSIYDGNNTEVSRTYFDYDRYDAFSLQECPNIAQHDGGYNTGYGRRGNQTLVTKLVTLNPASPIYLHRQYNIAGSVVRTVDPRGNPTFINYSDRFGGPSGEARSNTPPVELGSQLSYAFPTQVTNAIGHTTYAKFDYHLGKLVDTEDQNEVVTSFSYNDPIDRPTQVVHASNIASLKNQTTHLYNDVARTITTTSDRDRFDDNILTSIVYYDGLGRTWRSAGDEGATWAITDTRFDALGRVSQVSNPYRAADPDSAVAPASGWTKTVYDSLSRVVDVESPDGAHITTLYSGNQVTVIDQASKRRRSEIDAFGRLVKVIEDPGVLNYITSYSYDALNNLRQVTQGSQIRTFAYDSLSQLISSTNPESGTMTYAYDPNGNLIEKIDARGVKTTMAYDSLNRITSKTYSGTTDEGRAAANATQPVSYFYDAPSSLPPGAPSWPGAPSKGRLIGVTYGTGSEGTYHQYDARGRIVTNHQRMGTANYVTRYTYDLADGVLTERRGSPTAEFLRTSSAYDTAGRLKQMMTSFTPFLTESILVSDITYTPFGALQSETYGNDLIHSMGYNNRHQLTEIRLGRPDDLESVFTIYNIFGTAQNPNVPDPEITLLGQNNGNIARIKYSVSGTVRYTQTFLYDALNRLQYAVEHSHGNRTDAARAWYQTFAYDPFGNRGINTASTSDNVDGENSALQLADFSSANNRIIRVGHAYDSAGNLIAAPGQSHTYDGENRLVRAVVGGVVSEYVYDGFSRRVKKTVGGVGTIFEYGVRSELIGERNASTGALTKAYFYRNGELLATTEDGTTHKFATADHLGTPRAWTDRFGNVIQGGLHDYAPFGEELFAGYGVRTTSQGYAESTQQDGQRIQFTSKERDKETGLGYFLGRYSSPLQGRFISVDPYNPFIDDPGTRGLSVYSAQPQNWNRYTYALNNPLVYIDPDGENPLVSAAIGLISGAATGAAIEFGKQAYQIYTGKRAEFSLTDIGAKAANAAIFGAVVGATFNPAAASAAVTTLGIATGTTTTAVAIGTAETTAALASAGIVGGIVERGISSGGDINQAFAPGSIAIDGLAGGASGLIARPIYQRLYTSLWQQQMTWRGAMDASQRGAVGAYLTRKGYDAASSIAAGQVRGIIKSGIASGLNSPRENRTASWLRVAIEVDLRNARYSSLPRVISYEEGCRKYGGAACN